MEILNLCKRKKKKYKAHWWEKSIEENCTKKNLYFESFMHLYCRYIWFRYNFLRLSFIFLDCCCLEPIICWHRTSSSLLKFKDSTRHYTGPGRQLPFVTTVAVSCSPIAYLGLLNYMCLLKLCSISVTKISTFQSKNTRFLAFSLQRAEKQGRKHNIPGDELLLWSVSL